MLFISCNDRKKYEMNNMIPEMVDVTEYIESGNFKPDSCEGRLDKLVKIKPILLDQSFEIKLQQKITKWKKEINSIQNLYKKTIYQYSYIIDFEPVDVYRTELETKANIKKNFYIRINQKGEIISNYSDSNWVKNNCEKL